MNQQKSSDNLLCKVTKVLSETALEFDPEDAASLPLTSIFNQELKCSDCGYSTKVRANLLRHFHFHKTEKELPIPAIAPFNPVPCLDRNERRFDKVYDLASSSNTDIVHNKGDHKQKPATTNLEDVPSFVPSNKRFTCGANNCDYLCLEESMLRSHIQSLHSCETEYKCTHCQEDLSKEKGVINIDQILKHLRMHDLHLYKCSHCKFIHYFKHKVDRHVIDKHGDPMVIVVREYEHEPEEEATSVVQEEIKELQPWCCSMCKYRCSTMNDIIAHLCNKHKIESRFKCALCQYNSNMKLTFGIHFDFEHPGQTIDIIDTYYEEKIVGVELTNFDTIWQRESNVRYIRGIPIDESL